MIAPVFVVASGWFLIALALLLVIELIAVEGMDDPAPGWAWFWAFVWGAVIVAFTDARPWNWVIDHWVATVAIVVLYIACGTGWALLKWYWWVHEQASRKISKEYLDPTRSTNKSRLLAWMTWWPVSMLWWVLKWPRELFNVIYNQLLGTFKQIVDNAYPAQDSAKGG